MSDNQFNFGPTVISNSLNDSSTTKALSAAKGKELSESIIKPITIDLDTVTNTSGSYTHTTTIATTGLITEGMKCIGLEVGNPAAFGDMPTITAGNDEITLSCSSVSGTSTVKVTMMRTTQATSSGIMPTAVTSEEFDILADRIGDIDDLTTTAKTDVVAAVNELKTSSDEHNTAIGNMSYQIANLFTVTDAASVAANSTLDISYPSGFTNGNTWVIGIIVNSQYFDWGNFGAAVFSTKIRIYNNTSSAASIRLLLVIKSR